LALRQVGEAHLHRRAGAAEALVAARRRNPALAETRPAARPTARRRRGCEANRGAEEFPRAQHRGSDARRARCAVGAVERFQGAAAPSTAGLVPPPRGERYPLADQLLAPPALVRLARRGLEKKKPACAGFFVLQLVILLFQLAFFVQDVLPRLGIVLLDL